MIIAACATMKHRQHTLVNAVKSLYGQVDRMYLYLNGYDAIPDFCLQSKITCVRSCDAGWTGTEGKFFWSAHGKFRWLEEHCDLYVCFDDDIIYPADYVSAMERAVERCGGNPVGVHASRIKPMKQYTGYHKSLDLFARFESPWQSYSRAHLLGSGTLVLRPSVMRVDFSKFYVPNMADLWFAIQARENGIPLHAVPRPTQWLRAQPVPGYSVSVAKAGGKDLCETELLNRYAPWPELPPLHGGTP